MSKTSVARGNKTRQTNKELRRQRILDIAREQIASRGFEAFTLKDLAAEAEVTVPTVHNLFGKKYDIYRELCTEMVVRIEQVLSNPEISDPIMAIEAFVDNLLSLYRDDEAFYRAAFVAGERAGLFEHDLPTGIYNMSLKIAENLCRQAKENGFLKGRVDSGILAEQLFSCQRLARHDWVGGYIDLDRYRAQVLIGMCLTYAADATPKFHLRLCTTIDNLIRDKAGN
ncbi:MAG: TetR/AcrR family transcriptional regulator [Pseudomonadales bacterium]